eukprot:365667-Chlamydomonas_euryale.AAC.6
MDQSNNESATHLTVPPPPSLLHTHHQRSGDLQYLLEDRVVRRDDGAVKHRVGRTVCGCKPGARLLRNNDARGGVPGLEVELPVGIDHAWVRVWNAGL